MRISLDEHEALLDVIQASPTLAATPRQREKWDRPAWIEMCEDVGAEIVCRVGALPRLRAVADDLAFRANLASIPGVAEAMRRWGGRPPRWLPRSVRRACERSTP